MKHKHDKRLTDIYTMPIDYEIVEPRVYDLLEGQQPDFNKGKLEEAQALAKTELIRNKSIPFRYWLEQPCPSGRNTEGQIAPCVTLRRGLHEFMMETSPDYAARGELMLDMGFVATGGSSASQCLRIGHLSAGNVPARAWAVEVFVKTGTGMMLNIV
ncbi:hypothetical protein V8C44DRAFT_112226 [Trichoderma aethiopicum]